MLRTLKLSNFKCFESLDLACAPLTLLCGINGMGKSSVIQAPSSCGSRSNREICATAD